MKKAEIYRLMDLDDEIKKLEEVISYHHGDDSDFMTDQYEAKRKELVELKDSLALLYAQKAMVIADGIWNERGLTNNDMDKWLNKH